MRRMRRKDIERRKEATKIFDELLDKCMGLTHVEILKFSAVMAATIIVSEKNLEGTQEYFEVLLDTLIWRHFQEKINKYRRC